MGGLSMTVELTWLVYVCLFTMPMRVPYILKFIAVRGLEADVAAEGLTRFPLLGISQGC